MAEPELTPERAEALMASRRFVVLLALSSVVGVLVSLAAWCFLELTYQMQQGLFVHLPSDLGYDDGPPLWYLLPVLGLAGLITAFAIARLPGRGGHLPVAGLATGEPTRPVELPGVMLAAIATVGLGLVLGPEAPLIALGMGLALALMGLSRREVPDQALLVIAASGSFAALSFIFSSPLIAAIILIEATGLGGQRMRVILLPGLLAAGIGSLVSIGIGSLTGLSTSAYSLGALALPDFERPTVAQFAWTLALALAVPVGVHLIFRLGWATERLATPRPFVVLPLVGLIVAGLASAFAQIGDKSAVNVLQSGQDALPGLVAQAGSWSIGTLALLIVCKGLAYGLSLGSFRGGPTFPALFLGAAAGLMASHLPGLPITPAVAVCMGAATVSALRLPLAAVVLALVLTANSGPGAGPLVIVAVVTAYLVTILLSRRGREQPQPSPQGATVPAASTALTPG